MSDIFSDTYDRLTEADCITPLAPVKGGDMSRNARIGENGRNGN